VGPRTSAVVHVSDTFRVNIDSDPARPVVPCGSYDDATVATPEVVHHAVFRNLRHAEHFVDNSLLRGHEDHVRCPCLLAISWQSSKG